MTMTTVGLLHPGAMGASVGAALRSAGREVLWVDAGRGKASRERAERAGLSAVDSVRTLTARCQMIVSVCPPAAARQVADEVAACAFDGVYLDANAIAPASAGAVGRAVERGGARFVDGGIIGPPAWQSGSTRLYLSGETAAEAAACFTGGQLDARVIAGDAGAASALKMAYAAYTKGHSALLIAVRALAAKADIEAALLDEWRLSQPGLIERSEQAARANAAKAWRFEGEMREIAATFAEVGLPDGFHHGAGDLYRALAGFKDQTDADADEVIAALRDRAGAAVSR